MSAASQDNFQPIHNPYIVGNPIKDQKMFFGREDDFTYIRQKITGQKGGVLVLCGSRRSGKTSILFQIMNGRLGGEFFPVLIDMQAMTVENDQDFLIKLAKGVIDAIGSDISLQADFFARESGSTLMVFQDLVVKVSRQLGDKKLILLFDEYEIFESHIEKGHISTEILNVFANWIEHEEGVFIVFAGSDRLEDRTASYWGNFLGKALHRRVSFLRKPDAMRLILEPVRDLLEYEEDVPERIYELTAGQPFYTQVFCQALVDHLNESHKNNASLDDVQDVVVETIENPLPQMVFAWNSLTNMEKLGLSIIAELNKEKITPVQAKDVLEFADREKIGYKLDANKLNESLERLFIHDVLDKETIEETYTFKLDLWRRWLARMHSIWQVIDEVGRDEQSLGEGIEPAKKKRSKRMMAVAAVVTLLAAGGLSQLILRPDVGVNQTLEPVDSAMISIATTPLGANAFLGDDWIGRSPIDSHQVMAARAPLRIELAGFETFIDTVTLLKDELLTRTITLVERSGNLLVTSAPSGARISLGAEDTGLSTPDTIKGMSVNERHQIRLKLAGFGAGSYSNVRVFEDSTARLHHEFSKLVAPLTISSQPSGASIEVDGKSQGVTPQPLSSLTYGTHEIVLQKAGYETKRISINIPAPNNRVEGVLSKLPPGKLKIRVAPYADVYIDGVIVKSDAVNHEVELDVGTHTIELRHPRFEDYSVEVEIVSKQTHIVDYDFQP